MGNKTYLCTVRVDQCLITLRGGADVDDDDGSGRRKRKRAVILNGISLSLSL
ncbi:hypothetical protein PVAG01_01332 [Phlyctema vagabunda]|uniref:Uncharacterized protein n=1 Tax=Phlyctema vagabunda TaxID=108571 RepID=A0ABR4PXA5_9HELO